MDILIALVIFCVMLSVPIAVVYLLVTTREMSRNLDALSIVVNDLANRADAAARSAANAAATRSAETPPSQGAEVANAAASLVSSAAAAPVRESAPAVESAIAAASAASTAPPAAAAAETSDASATPVQSVTPPAAAPLPCSFSEPSAASSPLIESLDKQQVEAFLGKRGLTWTGAAVLFFAAIFFLRHAFANRLLTPGMQVALAAAAGALLIVVGCVLARRMRPLGQGLTGLGQAVLYATFAVGASDFYDPPVLGRLTALVLLTATTAVGFALAIGLDALSAAILAVLGGLITPLMVATDVNPRDALFVYLLILNLGTLAVAFFRNWRVLDVIVIVGVYLLFDWWRVDYYDSTQLAAALGWASGFYALFLALPFVFDLSRRRQVPAERFVMALTNAACFFFLAAGLLDGRVDDAYALVAAALAGVYFVAAASAWRLVPGDRRCVIGMMTLALSFLTAAVWLYFEGETRVLLFAIMAVALVQLGWSFDRRLIRGAGYALLVIAAIHSVALLPPYAVDYDGLFTRRLLNVLIVPAAAVAVSLAGWRHRAAGPLDERRLRVHLGHLGVAAALAMIFANLMAGIDADYYPLMRTRSPELFIAWFWTAASLVLLTAGRWTRVPATLFYGTGMLAPAILAVAPTLLQRGSHEGLLLLNEPLLTGLAVAGAVGLYALGVRRAMSWPDGQRLRGAPWTFASIALGLAMLFLSIEVFQWTFARWGLHWAQIILTALWSLFALTLLLGGLAGSLRPMRLTGLALLGVCAGKLFLADMAAASDLLRFSGFLVTGGLFITGAFAYNRFLK